MDKKLLDLNDLENVTGGKGTAVSNTANSNSGTQVMPIECPKCHHVFGANVLLSSVECPKCQKIIEIKG